MRPKKVILCVDDNEQELSVLKFTLETNGYRVLAASNGQEAIAIFATAPQVDLVLADTNMPQMSGVQLAERLKRMSSRVPMILLGDAQAGALSGSGEIHVADAVMARRNCSSFELLERVKVMSARKRGPRKGAQRIPQEDVLAAAS
jgi:two-component system, OmpR family, response regulator CpxR